MQIFVWLTIGVVVALSYGISGGSQGARTSDRVEAILGERGFAGCVRPSSWHPDYEASARRCAEDRRENFKK